MSKRSLRDQALQALIDVRLPPGWDPTFHQHLKYQRTVFRWPPKVGPGMNIAATGMIQLTALGAHPGEVEVSGGGCTVTTAYTGVQEAVDHVLAWIDKVPR